MGTVFFAGTYGVGKSTVLEKLSVSSGIPAFSAGDLISERNGEAYGANKVVSDKTHNQTILIDCISELLKKNPRILLAGHFCIMAKDGCVDHLPRFVFENINLEKIILLEAPVETIVSNLSRRDNKSYSSDFIEEMLQEERSAAKHTAASLGIPLVVYKMTFSEKDKEVLMREL